MGYARNKTDIQLYCLPIAICDVNSYYIEQRCIWLRIVASCVSCVTSEPMLFERIATAGKDFAQLLVETPAVGYRHINARWHAAISKRVN
ncbi:uncharacterized protein BXIN_1054 [Babesia sp. Xinjiang]|uniref:uncharacterized protein n=1 Tax=Babesia sp. Xinjiang TaxID=462227 RepID=UPI000A25C330|nr:uncharacterized protein BXIN_1054 [Babesia sp. Xinjiang]ORM41992.1 hypothetical protein BXIN_1054 [Babesia sp. Xinjiang]